MFIYFWVTFTLGFLHQSGEVVNYETILLIEVKITRKQMNKAVI